MNNRNDILNELKEISPLLSIPAGYFEQLYDSCLSEINVEFGLLSSIQKEKINVPDSYFDTFSDSVLSKIKKEEYVLEKGKIIELPKQEHKIFTLFKRVALAASIVGAVFFVKKISEPALSVNNCEDGIACLTQDEIFNYIDANSHEFEVQDVQDAVKSTLEIQETKIEMNENEIEKYIEDNKNIIEAEDASTDIF
jgi:hypothetical protein